MIRTFSKGGGTAGLCRSSLPVSNVAIRWFLLLGQHCKLSRTHSPPIAAIRALFRAGISGAGSGYKENTAAYTSDLTTGFGLGFADQLVV